MSEWISVEDRFPKIGQTVLTIGMKDNGDFACPVVATLMENNEKTIIKFVTAYNYSGDRLLKMLIETHATHWQPLPEPPQGD